MYTVEYRNRTEGERVLLETDEFPVAVMIKSAAERLEHLELVTSNF